MIKIFSIFCFFPSSSFFFISLPFFVCNFSLLLIVHCFLPLISPSTSFCSLSLSLLFSLLLLYSTLSLFLSLSFALPFQLSSALSLTHFLSPSHCPFYFCALSFFLPLFAPSTFFCSLSFSLSLHFLVLYILFTLFHTSTTSPHISSSTTSIKTSLSSISLWSACDPFIFQYPGSLYYTWDSAQSIRHTTAFSSLLFLYKKSLVKSKW